MSDEDFARCRLHGAAAWDGAADASAAVRLGNTGAELTNEDP
jgi:hypothetical protein